MCLRFTVWLILGVIKLALTLEINMTRFDNCPDGLEASEEYPIQIQEVHHDYNDEGFIDRIYGTYLVRTIDMREQELTIIVYKCTIEEPPPCQRKVEHIITDLHCGKFRNDDSGIWYMVSQAMTGSTCGGEMGVFNFEIPRVDHKYFEKYLTGTELSSRYRMHLLFHKKCDETKDRRACVEILFDVYN